MTVRLRLHLPRANAAPRAPRGAAEELEAAIRLRLYGSRHQVDRLTPTTAWDCPSGRNLDPVPSAQSSQHRHELKEPLR